MLLWERRILITLGVRGVVEVREKGEQKTGAAILGTEGN